MKRLGFALLGQKVLWYCIPGLPTVCKSKSNEIYGVGELVSSSHVHKYPGALMGKLAGKG